MKLLLQIIVKVKYHHKYSLYSAHRKGNFSGYHIVSIALQKKNLIVQLIRQISKHIGSHIKCDVLIIEFYILSNNQRYRNN